MNMTSRNKSWFLTRSVVPSCGQRYLSLRPLQHRITMKRLCLLIIFSFIVSNISARNKIKRVYYEFRALEYAYISYVAEYNIQDKQLVLKEQPHPVSFSFEEVIDYKELDSLVCDLIKHRGNEIQHDQCMSCKEIRVYQKYKKKIHKEYRPSYLSSFKNLSYPVVILIRNKGYLVIHPDFANLKQYILCYNGKYYTIRTSDCNGLLSYLSPWHKFLLPGERPVWTE